MAKILNFAYELTPEWSLVAVAKCGSTMIDRNLEGKYPKYGAKHELSTKGAIIIVRNPLDRLLSYYRDFVVRGGKLPTNHYVLMDGIGLRPSLDSLAKAIIRTPDDARDPHFCSYGRYTACAEIVRPVALESLSETWPKDVPMPFDPSKKVRTTEDKGERMSPEVQEAWEDAYQADFLLWEEAIAELEDE